MSLIQACFLQRLKPNSMRCLELFPDVRSFLFFSVFSVPAFPSFIFHQFRIIISGLFIFVHFRINPSCFRFASQSIISGYSSLPETCPKVSVLYVPSFQEISVIHISSYPGDCAFRKIPSCFQFVAQFISSVCFMFRHVRKFPSFIFYFIISGSFPDYTAVLPFWPSEYNLIQACFFPLETETQQYEPSCWEFDHLRFIYG